MRSALIPAVAALVLIGAAACTGPDAPPSPLPTSSPGPSSPSPSPTPSPDESEHSSPPLGESTLPASLPPVAQPTPRGGPWEPMDAVLRSPDDALALAAAPEDLRWFLAARLGAEDEAGCAVTSVELFGIHRDGFAFGTEDTTCGGAHTVWGITGNRWEYVVQYGDAMPCEYLAQNDIPPGAPRLRCDGDEGVRDY